MLLNKPSAFFCFLNVSCAPLLHAKGILFFSFMYSPPSVCHVVAKYSLVVMEFAWDVDTCFAAFYKAERTKMSYPGH